MAANSKYDAEVSKLARVASVVIMVVGVVLFSSGSDFQRGLGWGLVIANAVLILSIYFGKLPR